MRHIICSLAGPQASELHRHQSKRALAYAGRGCGLVKAWAAGDGRDWGQVWAAADWIEPGDPMSAVIKAQHILTEFFAEPGIWAQILSVADVWCVKV